MSLDTEVAQLTGRANTLIDTFNSKDADIEQRVNAALQAIPETGKSFYVDQVNGSDTNDGSESSPLKSIKEAIARTPNGGTLYITLLSDYRLAENISATNVTIRITAPGGDSSNVSETQKKFHFDVFNSGGRLEVASIRFYQTGALHFEFIQLILPDVGGTGISEGSCFGPKSSGDAFQMILKLTYSDIVVPDETTFLMDYPATVFSIIVFSATYPAAMAGKWFRGISAGTEVSSKSNITSSGITTL